MHKSLFSLTLLGLMFAAPAEAGVRNFFLPEIAGARVDACLEAGTCGKPAADFFCKVQGYDRAMIFQREASAQSRRIDSGQICATGACTAFKQVKCFTADADLALLQD